jgi:hypothetical protein
MTMYTVVSLLLNNLETCLYLKHRAIRSSRDTKSEKKDEFRKCVEYEGYCLLRSGAV